MGLFSVKADHLDVVGHEVSIYPVDHKEGWVANNQLLYSPHEFMVDKDIDYPRYWVDLRAAFSLDRAIVGSRHRRIPDNKLGQVALIAHRDDADEVVRYSTAVMVPTSREAIIITAAVAVEAADLPQTLQSPTYDVFFGRVVAEAIFEAVNGFEPLNLMSKELNGS